MLAARSLLCVNRGVITKMRAGRAIVFARSALIANINVLGNRDARSAVCVAAPQHDWHRTQPRDTPSGELGCTSAQGWTENTASEGTRNQPIRLLCSTSSCVGHCHHRACRGEVTYERFTTPQELLLMAHGRQFRRCKIPSARALRTDAAHRFRVCPKPSSARPLVATQHFAPHRMRDLIS
jgi:hypothetical protein